MAIDVLGGDFGKAVAVMKMSWSGKPLSLVIGRGFFRSEEISLGRISGAERVTDENKASLLKGAKWATVGWILAGPLGAIAGALLGGKKRTVVYMVTLSDGRQMLCQSPLDDYKAVLVAAMTMPRGVSSGQSLLEDEHRRAMQDKMDEEVMGFLRQLEGEHSSE
ncbi:MAG TPA: hypothetical protein VJL29_02760 [Thermoguttaceae bacterium]|nr:hypothetical protein [Thermoguttaceae bacterium]